MTKVEAKNQNNREFYNKLVNHKYLSNNENAIMKSRKL